MGEVSFPFPVVHAMERESIEGFYQEDVGPLRWPIPVVPEMEGEDTEEVFQESVRPPTPPPPPPPEQYPLLYHPNVLRSLGLGHLVDERPPWSIPLQPGEYPPNIRLVGSETPMSESVFQRDLPPPYFQPFFFVRDTPSTAIVSSTGSPSTIVSSSMDQVVPSNVVHSPPLRSAGPILAANVSVEDHSVPDNDELEGTN